MRDEPDLDELRRLLGQVARQDASTVGPDEDLRAALGVDSLTALRLLAVVEKRHGVRLPDARLSELTTLRRVADALKEAKR